MSYSIPSPVKQCCMKQIWATRRPKVMRLFKATGLRYPINIVSGGEGVYILSGVKEKRQEWEIDTIVWVFQLLLAGIVYWNYEYLYSQSTFCTILEIRLHILAPKRRLRSFLLLLYPLTNVGMGREGNQGSPLMACPGGSKILQSA